MTVGERISVKLKELRLSQSELARRAKVSQPLINGLVRGTVRSTPQLHRIARELGTTPAYLTGEVDDPDLDAPEPPALTAGEVAWVEIYRGLDVGNRDTLMRVARSMTAVPVDRIAEVADSPSSAVPQGETVMMPVLFPPEAYLTRMFEALLAMVDPAAPTEEQARSLAQNLPIGLSQLRDLLPLPAPVDATDASSDQPKTLVEQP